MAKYFRVNFLECIRLLHLKVKNAALAKIVWRVHDQKGKLLVLEWIDAIAPID